MTASHPSAASDARIRILVVVDHPVIREALARAIDHEPDFRVLGQADTGTAADAWQRLRPDVTILDIAASGAAGIGTVRRIRSHDAAARVIVLTSSHRQGDEQAVMHAGAAAITGQSGYGELLAAIRATCGDSRRVADAGGGGSPAGDDRQLSAREFEVLHLLREGLGPEAIATRLSVTDRTVRAHVAALKTKLAAASAAQCVARGYESGLFRRA